MYEEEVLGSTFGAPGGWWGFGCLAGDIRQPESFTLGAKLARKLATELSSLCLLMRDPG